MSGFDDEQEVGYGKPPKHSRFKPGQSGNPKGRPKKPEKNFANEVQSELDLKVVVRENGREIQLTKGAVIVKTLVGKAMKGDVRAWREIRELLPKLFQLHADAKRTSASSDDDAQLLDQFLGLFGGGTERPPQEPQGSSTTKEPGNAE
ncbi:hypothetical protein FJ420_13120 [Mesorhizobium sp. B3-1-3]|uniref:DUF5681 domain-containing protein n=1 Tax=unclassified Mesorhizobium TaxID=325217 RepID=UPI00112DE54A|nr:MULTISPECIES: DUF5681 domain-containing protein [unclassified Mesorhizobium]TPI63366.1 hypothetical protein FJ424_19045 [Mesorhizobium sp. B3-1-8]TPI72286.1 hypothetical protein FJ420_13120 [Mesorhizobium sp. B3-1-3]